jgi:hypothetical protein
MFDHVAGCINAMYKALFKDVSACARLESANENEAYLDDIEFDCAVPSKRYRPIELFSGGEKTLAALTLLFAILRIYLLLLYFWTKSMLHWTRKTCANSLASSLPTLKLIATQPATPLRHTSLCSGARSPSWVC